MRCWHSSLWPTPVLVCPWIAIVVHPGQPSVGPCLVTSAFKTIILLATIVYWMDPKALGERIRVSFTGLLTAVAYQFTTADALPQHVYNSYLDAVVALSLAVMVFSIVESLVVSRYVLGGKQAVAVRVDVTARWMVPGAYLAGLATLFLVYTA